MPHVKGLTFYLGHSPAAKHAQVGQNLAWEDGGSLCKFFHNALLKSQARFNATVRIPELPPLECQWTGVGQTAGVAVWLKDSTVGAASIFLNGLELDQELQQVVGCCETHHLRVPPDLPQQIAQRRCPLLLTFHYTLQSFADPTVPTAAEALANAFFTMFGTNDEEPAPESQS